MVGIISCLCLLTPNIKPLSVTLCHRGFKPEPENTRLAVKLSSRIVDKCQIYKSKAGDIGHYYLKKEKKAEHFYFVIQKFYFSFLYLISDFFFISIRLCLVLVVRGY